MYGGIRRDATGAMRAPPRSMITLTDRRFRSGLALLTATAVGSALAAWGLGALVMEAVTLPDRQAVAVVAALSGIAAVAFGAAFVPLGFSIKRIADGLLARPIPAIVYPPILVMPSFMTLRHHRILMRMSIRARIGSVPPVPQPLGIFVSPILHNVRA